MLRSFLLISIRHILNKGWVSGLNVFCLSLGGAICIFVYSYFSFEKNHDAAFNQEYTYRLERHTVAAGGPITKDALIPVSWTTTLKKGQELQINTARLIPYSEERSAFFEMIDLEDNHKTLHFKNTYIIESAVLDLFPFQWIKKPEKNSETNAILLSRSIAELVLGSKDFEKTNHLTLKAIQNNGLPSPALQITGIYEDFPMNSNLIPDVLIFSKDQSHSFTGSGHSYAYARTTQPLTLEQQSFIGKKFPEGESLFLRPVTSIHFATGVSNNPKPAGNKLLLMFLTVIGVIIMLLSVTNYTVSTIFSTIDRMREVGVRKLLGMRPTHLLGNFLTESLLIHLLSAVLAMAMFQYTISNGLPFMPEQKTIGSGNPLDFQAISAVSLNQTILFTLALFLSSTLLSCLYPALYFNGIKPVFLLKGRLQVLNSAVLKGANSVVKILIVFQLTSSILFLSGLLLANQELAKANATQLQPFDMKVRGIFPGLTGANDTFKQMATSSINDLKTRELIRHIQYGNLYQDQIKTRGSIAVQTHKDSAVTNLQLRVVDPSYWKDTSSFLAGENFHPEFGSDPFHIIVNQNALEQLSLGRANQAINDSLYSNMGNFKIIGITTNHEEEPVVFVSGFRYRTYLDITLHFDPVLHQEKDPYAFLTAAEVNLSTAFPKINILKREFQKEQLIGEGINVLFLLFSVLTLAIAAFGLFNLSNFIVEKRAKEIDIRKLLGAQKANLISIMSSDLFQLVIAASIFAAPIIYLTVNIGLSQYTSHTDLSPLLISVPAMIVLTLALLVAIPRCWQQANSNLSRSLGRR